MDIQLIHSHLSLVPSIDLLVGDQASGRDHVGSHAVSDVKQNVLGLPDIVHIADKPIGRGRGAIVAQDRLILARLVQNHASVSFGCNIDQGWSVGILRKKILVPKLRVRLNSLRSRTP